MTDITELIRDGCEFTCLSGRELGAVKSILLGKLFDQYKSHSTQVFNVGTHVWEKPEGAKVVLVVAIAGGSGGGSGRRGNDAIVTGGSGGGGSGFMQWVHQASTLNSTEPVIVGAGGIGGASVTTDDTDGFDGESGGFSLFGSARYALAPDVNPFYPGVAHSALMGGSTTGLAGGGGGKAGVISQSGGRGYNFVAGYFGGYGDLTGGTTRIMFSTTPGFYGGGGGGGSVNAGVATNGGYGVSTYGFNLDQGFLGSAPEGADGWTRSNSGLIIPGWGGGGGAGGATMNAGNGGNGSDYGAGGGGGGASRNGFLSGAGGNGSDGVVMVTTFF